MSIVSVNLLLFLAVQATNSVGYDWNREQIYPDSISQPRQVNPKPSPAARLECSCMLDSEMCYSGWEAAASATGCCPRMCCTQKMEIDNQLDCGISNSASIKISDLNEADERISTNPGQFPWILSIVWRNYSKTSSEEVFLCVASLLTSTIAITAAHCIDTYEKAAGGLYLKAGEHDLNDSLLYPELPPQERLIIKKILHSHYARKPIQFDVALLKVEDPFILKAGHINTVCLPKSSDTFFNNTGNCYAAGWNVKADGTTIDNRQLKKTEQTILPFHYCQNIIGKRGKAWSHNYFHYSFLCSIGHNKYKDDTCKGDGGGPLACTRYDKEKYYLAGITSWGVGSCNSGLPGASTDVVKMLDWIYRSMEEMSPKNYQME